VGDGGNVLSITGVIVGSSGFDRMGVRVANVAAGVKTWEKS
jgi:hypothetical protein